MKRKSLTSLLQEVRKTKAINLSETEQLDEVKEMNLNKIVHKSLIEVSKSISFERKAYFHRRYKRPLCLPIIISEYSNL